MLVTTTEPTTNSGPPSRTPSILDSPTLARVERARLRLEASSNQNLHHNQLNHNNSHRDGSLERSLLDPTKKEVPWHQVWTHMKRLSNSNAKVNSTNTLTTQKTQTMSTGKCSMIPDKKATTTSTLNENIFHQQVYYQPPEMQSLLAGRIPVGSMTGPIKRGLLWQQRDRLFSRWKERYFVLTRDYLHCFKRASGSANERASDMGQFIFKVKLVDVEKVEWLNRRSYSAIGLLLGREGRVLLRCDDGLEDWFELLEECTLTSKERRRALKITQGPRSRASLAAPVSHASLQAHHFGLGGTYSSALDDWLMTNGGGGRHKIGSGSVGGGATNPFLFSDSVPDLSALSNENHHHNHHHHSGLSTNHSTPQKIPYASAGNNNNLNLSRYSNGYVSQNSSYSNGGGLYGSPRRIFINSSFGSNHVFDEEIEDAAEVQMRRHRGGVFRNKNLENGNELDRDWLYRKPRAPTDVRHSVQTTDLDHTANDSGLDTPPSTHRPSSYRDISHHASPRDSTETTVSSSRGTLLNSPGGSFRAKHSNQVTNLNQVNALNGSRYSVQERILKIRNEEDRCASIRSANRLNHNNTADTTPLYDPNQNRYYKNASSQQTPQYSPAASNAGLYSNNDRSYSDCQQGPPRRSINNNPSPTPRRAPIFGTPTRV